MTEKMRAAVFYGPRDIRIEEIDRPKANADGIVVRVRAAAICGSDLHPYTSGPKPKEPIVRGHENAGDVVEVGENVNDLEVGDRVWVNGVIPCYTCDWCKQGGYRIDYYKCRNFKPGGIWKLHGGLAEYVWAPLVVQPQKGHGALPSVVKLPDTMSYQDGALVEPFRCQRWCAQICPG